MTPEGKVKYAFNKRIRAIPIHERPWGFYPVPAFGSKGVPDWIGVIRGYFIAVEFKAPGKVPTTLQRVVHRAIEAAGGVVFVIDQTDGPSMDAFFDYHWELFNALD